MTRKDEKELLNNLAFLIETTDSYRVGRNTDPRKVESTLQEIFPHVSDILDSSTRKKYKRITDFIINLPSRDRNIAKWSAVFTVFRFLLRITLLGFTVAFGLAIYNSPLTFPVLYFLTFLLYIVLIGRWYSLNKVLDFYEFEMSNQPGKDSFLRELAQKLIDRLRDKILEFGVKPKKYRLHLFKTDYNGIKIIKRPGWLRDYYLVEVEI